MRKPRTNSGERMCPCGTGELYANCCAALHAGMPAATPEALMRSRYGAFVLRLADYLLATWHPRTRPSHASLVLRDPPPKWLGLDVRRATVAGDRGEVEFVARYRIGGGPASRMHETSRFVREADRWYYVDGDQHS